MSTPAGYDRIVFVCEHGAAKSVLAAAYFNDLARAHGIAVRAWARGTAPDPEVSPIVVAELEREGLEVAPSTPLALSAADLQSALHVVTFDQPQVADLVGNGPSICAWNGMPAVSADFALARKAILERVRDLVDELENRTTNSSDGAPL